MSPEKCSVYRPVRRMGQFNWQSGRVRLSWVRGSLAVAGLLCVGAFGFVPSAHADARTEIITLADNTQVMGKLTHYYDGVIVIETTAGQKMELPRDKVKSISFKLPAARAEFSTPEKTFDRWRTAMLKGDGGKAVDCYALMYQGMVGQQMAQSMEQFKQAQKDLEGVVFDFKGASYQNQGDMRLATLKVRRTKGDNVQTDEIHLVLENGEWKMTP
mgnify:CR=1 FL=1